MDNESSENTRYGWVACKSCGGTGTTRYFRGNSITINHLARGGNPSKLPCSDCRGQGRNWGKITEPKKR